MNNPNPTQTTPDRGLPVPSSVEVCPFHDGPATLDGLLAEISPREMELLDAALDLRQEVARRADARAVLGQLFRLRRLLDGRHYLAFYRLRFWLQRVIIVQARLCRSEAWQRFSLPLDGARVDEIVDSTLARLTNGADARFGAHVRFVFAPTPLPRPSPSPSLDSFSAATVHVTGAPTPRPRKSVTQ